MAATPHFEILTAFVLSVFIFFLVHKGSAKKSNLLLALFFFSQFMGVLADLSFSAHTYFVDHLPHLLYVGVPFGLLWAPSLYLYVGSITQEDFWKNRWKFIHVVPFLGFTIYFLVQFRFLPVDEKLMRFEEISSSFLFGVAYKYILNFQIVLYNVLSLIALIKYRRKLFHMVSSFERINLNWLTFIIYGYLLACFFDDLFLQFLQNLVSFNPWIFSKLIFLSFFTVLFYKGFTSQEVFLDQSAARKYQASTLTASVAIAILQKLDRYVLEHHPQTNPELTLKKMASEIGVQERHLSQVINEHKQQNFYDFINTLRINEAKRMLSDPTNSYNILQILYEVGFNSKTAFNKAFKKQTGVTPSQYKKAIFQAGSYQKIYSAAKA